MKTVQDVIDVLSRIEHNNKEIFVKAAYNRFKISEIVVDTDGNYVLCIEEDASNPMVK